MDMKRYFLLNERDLSPSVARSALVEVKRQTSADPPRLTTVDVDGNYVVTTTSHAQLTLFDGFLKQHEISAKPLVERPKLKKARGDDQPTTRQETPKVAGDIDEIVQHVGKIFDHVGKLFDSLGKPK